MMKRFQLIQIAVIALALIGVFGCSDHQTRYDDPPWLGGSSIQTLEKEGNYTIFLKLMEEAGQKKTIERQLFTLFAPNDSAFNAYFQEAGIDSVGALTPAQARELFNLHVLPNARSKFQLIYEYLWSELQGPTGEYAALFFRKPTESTSAPYLETVPSYYQDASMRGKVLTMKTGKKLVPLFSKDYFEDFFGDPNGSDYEYMYPGSKWSTLGLNWGNAAVTNSEVRTANGFIYYIDQVVPPQKNIEQYMKANPAKFGLYYDILQRFANYSTSINEEGETRYLKSYDNLVSNVAEEQGAFVGNEVKMKDMFTAFIPNNEVLQAYLDAKVLPTYKTLDSVPKVTLAYILQTQLSRSLGLISKISKSYFNSFGDPMIITKDDIASAHMASNGLIYEMKKVLEPNVFTTVPGKLFFDAHYSTFLYALSQSGMISSLSNPNSPVTLFAPTNDQLDAYGIRYEPISQSIMYKGKDNKWNKMKTLDMLMFVQDHIYTAKLDNLTDERYIEMSSKNFVHIKDGGVQAAENLRYREYVTMPETNNEKNGILYSVSKPIKSNYGMGKYIVQDPEVSKFKDMLVKAGFLVPKQLDQITKDTIPNLKFLAEGDYWTALIPTNAAVDAGIAAGDIPLDTDVEGRKKFLLNHFIRKNVIFDDGQLSGIFPTQRTVVTPTGTTYVTVKITNTPGNLTIEGNNNQIVTVDHSKANILVRKGVIHKINSVLKY